ncbi:MAG: FtsK/SpoIIIE domain-containing protein [Candidatus Moraniibacteriota bacterium]
MPKIDINKKRGDPEARVDLERFWEKVADLRALDHLIMPLDWSQSIDSSSFRKFPEESDFFIPIGKADDGWASYDLSIGTNLLAAGSMLSGVGMFLRVSLLHLIKNHAPENFRVLLIDPVDNLADFDGIPHLLRPRVRSVEEGLEELDWLESLYNKRSEELREKGYPTIWKYQEEHGGASPGVPHILVVCSELGEFFRVDKDKTNKVIVKSFCAPRGLGVYTLFATQQPDAEKFEVFKIAPAIAAFQMPYAKESKLFTGAEGAEELLGQGDMYFSFVGGEDFKLLDKLKGFPGFDYENDSPLHRFRVQGLHVDLDKTRPMVEEACKSNKDKRASSNK